MELITTLLRKAVSIGIFALTLPVVAQAMIGEDAEIDAELATEVTAEIAAPVLAEANIDAEDLARGWKVVLRTQEQAQADLDRRYRIED